MAPNGAVVTNVHTVCPDVTTLGPRPRAKIVFGVRVGVHDDEATPSLQGMRRNLLQSVCSATSTRPATGLPIVYGRIHDEHA